jgi:hypothetical protein
MRKAITVLALLSMVSIASADLVVLRDLTDEAFLSPRDGVTYIDRDETGSFFAATLAGYNVVDANLYMEGGPTEGGNYLDITDDTIEIQLFYDDTTSTAPLELGYWVRMYAGQWDPDAGAYNYWGWANFACVVPNDATWHTFTKDVSEFEEPFADPSWYAQIYKYRVDAVKWDPSDPYFTMGIGSIPEPATLSLLVLGGLALLRRR